MGEGCLSPLLSASQGLCSSLPASPVGLSPVPLAETCSELGKSDVPHEGVVRPSWARYLQGLFETFLDGQDFVPSCHWWAWEMEVQQGQGLTQGLCRKLVASPPPPPTAGRSSSLRPKGSKSRGTWEPACQGERGNAREETDEPLSHVTFFVPVTLRDTHTHTHTCDAQLWAPDCLLGVSPVTLTTAGCFGQVTGAGTGARTGCLSPAHLRCCAGQEKEPRISG